MWKMIALLRGWREAYDEDMKLLVVYRSDWHFSGPNAWKLAALSPRKGKGK